MLYAAILLLAAALATALASCAPRTGWGLVLWTVKGTSAKAGSVVPVYLKSNITKEYVIGVQDDPKARLEVPLWQVELFRSRRAALARGKEFGEFTSIYMIAAKDGLPIREKTSNLAKRVYRLRESEMVKVLEKVEGEAMFTGQTKLPGDWYRVLTMDGTMGFVFSYTMRMFDESTGEAPSAQVAQSDSELLDSIFSKSWRPAWFETMMDENSVDLDFFALRFGLFGDAINRQVRIELPGTSKVFQYTTITQDKEWAVFEGTGLRIKNDAQAGIVASWGPQGEAESMPEATAGWKPDDTLVRFVVPSGDIREAIRAEEARRSDLLRGFFASVSQKYPRAASSGAYVFSDPSGSSLELWSSGLYSWNRTSVLPAGFAPFVDTTEIGQRGTAVFGLRLSDSLSSSWQGGFSLYPDDTGRRTDYAYSMDSAGLRIARLVTATPETKSGDLDRKFAPVTFLPSGR
jgi:hypothetical protein